MLLSVFCFPLTYVWSQSTDQNYIVITIPSLPLTDPTALTDANSNSTIQYFDGLGRPMETVQKAITPSGKDLVSLIEYDGLGRDYKHWSPVPTTGNTGAYVSPGDFTGLANTQYGSNEKPYSLTDFE